LATVRRALRLALSVVLAACCFAADRRVVAIGDLHGDLRGFLSLTQSAGLTDAKGKWTGGNSVLVQLGDVPDRGPDTRKILDLLMDLQKEARQAGGEVHSLIGNHEAMNVYGDLRYVTRAEFDAFRARNSRQLRDDLFGRELRELKSRPLDEDAYRADWEDRHPPGWVEHRLGMGPSGKYGKWIRSNAAVCKIDDSLFVHGGIAPKYGDWPLDKLNAAVRDELGDFSRLNGGVVMDPEGPLWHRELARGAEAALAAHVDSVLLRHGVKRIVIGHTPTPGAILPRLRGKVILADAGISQAHGGHRACLLVEGGSVSALHRGRKLSLPQGGAVELLAYLRTAAALDPQPSPLRRLIQSVASAGVPATY
jgi:hypothetical protein